LTLGWLLDGTSIQLIIEKRKNTKQKKCLSKFPKKYNLQSQQLKKDKKTGKKVKTDCISSESGTIIQKCSL